ncbi:MAG: glycosyltransferase [Acetatifactor sp.]|nr:glycosyltransferase [Acetatifactor sp.]
MRFSIIIVCLNAGEKLNQTLDSILSQTYTEYEIVVKDGGSCDRSIEEMRQDHCIRLFKEPDKGIYDAMNQAVAHARGDFLLFLNCGDLFYDEKVLERAAEAVESQAAAGADVNGLVLYGDTYSARNQTMIASAGRITGLTCYRNIPCHQSCFYSAALCKEKPYDLQYRIRADYDHFLWCYYIKKAKMIHMGMAVSSYEGGGVSEDKRNHDRDREEHRQITSTYMSAGELLRYRLFMLCTFAPLRSFLAENSFFSGGYHWLKERIYHRIKQE